ncbi:wnt8 isoform A [Frankliniella occidentalis]|uniref:Protein Wnt n=1 Tax=Frankliniella occidentalis TaxID=133901 RepID=A0A9C6U0M6_FRAOC|nr:protein Wnt-8b-like isoform X1 [Frankliniella occidentalis]KAE8749766.1 wnt8 isoform A [Frankliniella occidentalis]
MLVTGMELALVVLVLTWTVPVPSHGSPAESATTASFWSSNINSMFSGENSWATSALNEHLAAGAQLALDHCQEQFKWDRWNCPKSAFSRRGFKPANQETAFVLAATSAGVVHAVTRSCSAGNLPDCGCRMPGSSSALGDGDSEEPSLSDLKTAQQVLTNNPSGARRAGSTSDQDGDKNDVNSRGVGKKKWVWSGCSDHVAYGESVAAKFLDSLVRKGNDAWAYTSLHNNRAGRLAVRDSLQKHCKCHGVSGSCSLQTCWMAVPSFSRVASALRRQYDHAVRIDFEAGHGKLVLGNSASGLVQRSAPAVPPEKLVFLEESPDYCKVNNTTGWTGTKGRTCSRNRGEGVGRSERRSCKELCRACGHRVRRQTRQVSRHCQCSFQWCCQVKCKTCVETVKEHFCG